MASGPGSGDGNAAPVSRDAGVLWNAKYQTVAGKRRIKLVGSRMEKLASALGRLHRHHWSWQEAERIPGQHVYRECRSRCANHRQRVAVRKTRGQERPGESTGPDGKTLHWCGKRGLRKIQVLLKESGWRRAFWELPHSPTNACTNVQLQEGLGGLLGRNDPWPYHHGHQGQRGATKDSNEKRRWSWPLR